MPLLIIIGALVICTLLYLLFSSPTARPVRRWLKTGGLLGLLVLVARITRIPLATLFMVLPSLLGNLRAREYQQSTQTPPSRPLQMTLEEARLVLGVTEAATVQEIKKAHRTLMQKNHPDTGGSDYLAAKINQARDILLDKR